MLDRGNTVPVAVLTYRLTRSGGSLISPLADSRTIGTASSSMLRSMSSSPSIIARSVAASDGRSTPRSAARRRSMLTESCGCVGSKEMRGRVMSIDMMSHGLMPLGLLPRLIK